jgi:hypothetical protein
VTKFPFEVPFTEVQVNLEQYVAVVVNSLQSAIRQTGEGLSDYRVFHAGYEALKQATSGFVTVTTDVVLPVVQRTPVALIVLRSMLGFTPPE